jgi:hypothetical protein
VTLLNCPAQATINENKSLMRPCDARIHFQLGIDALR